MPTLLFFTVFYCMVWDYGETVVVFKMCSSCRKKAVRILADAPPRAHCRPLFVQERILTVVNAFIFICLVNVKCNLVNYDQRSVSHTHYTRNKDLLNVPYVRLTKTQSSPEIISLKLFNKLSPKARLVSLSKFKSCLFQWLVSNPFYSITEFLDLVKSVDCF